MTGHVQFMLATIRERPGRWWVIASAASGRRAVVGPPALLVAFYGDYAARGRVIRSSP